MQQIFNYILKNSTKILFLLLLIISFALTIQAHSFHRSKVISSANFLTGGVYEQVSSVSEYFNLKDQNEQLARENARLKTLFFNIKDSTALQSLDSIAGVDKTNIIVGKVIHNSYNVFAKKTAFVPIWGLLMTPVLWELSIVLRKTIRL